MSILTSFIAFGVFLFHIGWVVTTEIQFDRIEFLNKSYVEGSYNLSELRITKFNRTTYVLNGKAEIFIDINRDIKAEVVFHYNRLNNNQYTKSPLSLSKDYLCNMGEKYYRKFIMAQVKDCSNFPQPGPNEPICPIIKVNLKLIKEIALIYLISMNLFCLGLLLD